MSPDRAGNGHALESLHAGGRGEVIGPLDEFLGASRSVTEQLVVLRASLSRRLLTRGLGHRDFKGGPTADIPAGWEVKSLGEIARFASGKSKPTDATHVRSGSRCVPIYSGKGLLGFSGSCLRKGATIVVGRVGARCGEVHYVPDEESWITDSALFVYETRPEIDLRFLYHSLRRLDLPSLRCMGRQPLISLSTVYPLLLALPPLDEQREICDLLSAVETFQEAQDKVLVQATRVRSALVAHAAAGRAEAGRSVLRADLSTPRGA